MAKFPVKTLLFLIPKRSLSSSRSPPAPSFTVKYLVESCGLSSKSALSISQKLQLKEKNIHQAYSVLNLLKSHGFNDAHIIKFIRKCPQFLLSRINTNLKPKLEFLVQNGFVGKLLPEVLVKNPFMLTRKLTSHIQPSIEFLREVLRTDKRVVSTVMKGVMCFQCSLKDIMQPSIDLLRKEGIQPDRIANFIATRPGIMWRKLDNISHLVKLVKELGIQPSDPVFLSAIYVRVCMRESVWKKKVQIFESWGLSEEEIASVFRRCPFCFSCSEKNLRNTMDFYVNTAKLKPEAITNNPVLLTLSVDKRVRPRYNVYKVLMEEKCLNKKVKPTSLLIRNEEDFLKTYVIKHLEVVPSLMEVYNTTKKR